MGWITKRRMQTGRGIGGKASPETLAAPLRKIEYTIRPADSLFARSHVMLECGHEAFSNGIYRARCRKCAREASPSTPDSV
jgi:hypothetical protein